MYKQALLIFRDLVDSFKLSKKVTLRGRLSLAFHCDINFFREEKR